MTLSTLIFATLTGSLVLMKLGLMVFAIFLLVRATMRAGHPGSMNPNYVDNAAADRLQNINGS